MADTLVCKESPFRIKVGEEEEAGGKKRIEKNWGGRGKGEREIKKSGKYRVAQRKKRSLLYKGLDKKKECLGRERVELGGGKKGIG